MNYKYLLFDLDETLFDFKRTEQYALSNTMSDFHFFYSEEEHLPLYKSVNKVLWDQLEQGTITQEAIKVQRFVDFKAVMNLDYDPVKFSERFMYHLGEGSFLLDDAEELIASLAPHYELYALTNGLTQVQKRRMEKSPLAIYFKNSFISEEVGIAKPNPKLYEQVFQILAEDDDHFDRKKCLMIGDSLTSDIQGGVNAGIDTCWVNLNNKANCLSLTPSYEVNKLLNLKQMLLKP